MKRLLNEPLLHFLLIAIAIFVAYGVVSRRSSDPAAIIVTQGQVEAMVESFTRTWQRPPTSQELRGLLREHVRDEVYYREAVALGLDKDDSVIRRRLRQKLEFVSDDIAAQAKPTDADLNAYLQAHPDAFRVEPRFTFRQVYLNPEKHGANLERDAAHLVAQLNLPGSNVDAAALGDSSLLESEFAAVPASEVAKQFGEELVAKLAALSPGQWHGPIASGYGVHLIFVGERTEGRLPALAEVRDAVQREWANARRSEANERFYQELLTRYAVTIEQAQVMPEAKKLAEAQ